MASDPCSLLDLPDEVLVKVVLRLGLRSAALVACTCRRLQHVQQQARLVCRNCQVFASAGSQGAGSLQEAIQDAARRACDGMQGGVDFAMLLVSGFPVRLTDDPAALLQRYLPQGVPVVGCTVDGLLSQGPDGRPFEVDPSTRGLDARGVAVLLGCMPHHHVRPFVDTTGYNYTRAASKQEWPTPAACLRSWLAPLPAPAASSPAGAQAAAAAAAAAGVGQQQSCLMPSSVWLMATARHACLLQNVIDDSVPACWQRTPGELNLMEWAHRQQAGAVVAGGVVGGSRERIIFSPGAVGAALHPDWLHDSLKQAGFVGLAVCEKTRQPAVMTPGAGEAGGVAVEQQAGRVRSPVAGLPRGVRAACGALRGLQPVQVPGSAPALVEVTGLQVLQNLSFMSDGWVMCVAGKDVSRGTSLYDVVDQQLDDNDSVIDPMLALWLAPPGEGGEGGFHHAVLSPGGVLLVEFPHDVRHFIDYHGQPALVLELDAEALPHANTLASAVAAGQRVCAQLVDVSGAGCVHQLPPLVKALHTACSRPSHQQRAAMQVQEQQLLADVYQALRENAMACGARSGPCCAALFSCNGRGQAIFGEAAAATATTSTARGGAAAEPSGDATAEGPAGEAAIVDQALEQAVPLIGGYFAGEIGPALGCRWSSVTLTAACADSLKAAHHAQLMSPAEAQNAGTHRQGTTGAVADPAAATAAAAGSTCAGRPEWLQAALKAELGCDVGLPGRAAFQGYTSMYAFLG